MILYLACVTVLGWSNVILTVPFSAGAHRSDDGHYTSTNCTVHTTLKDAALAEFNRRHDLHASYGSGSSEKHTVEYYKLDVEHQTMVSIPAPKIRIEVDE